MSLRQPWMDTPEIKSAEKLYLKDQTDENWRRLQKAQQEAYRAYAARLNVQEQLRKVVNIRDHLDYEKLRRDEK